LWMSRGEIMTSIRLAMVEDVRKAQCGEVEEGDDYDTQEQHKGDNIAHENSMNSVITEYIQTVEICMQSR
jgi:hypothetical protein